VSYTLSSWNANKHWVCFLNDFLFLAGPSGLAVTSLQKADSLLVFNYTGKLKRFLRHNAGGIWIIKWSNRVNEIDCFELAKRGIVNYGYLFDFDEREVTWTITRLIEKGRLSSISISLAGDLPLYCSIVPAITTLSVNNQELVADALSDHPGQNIIFVTSDNT
jgi:hypothetical protein